MSVDVAVITALPLELDALVRHGGPWRKEVSSAGSIRTFYTCQTSTGVSIVGTCTRGVGQVSAALATREVLSLWHPKKVFLVGIAGGLGTEVELGDIVASEQVVDYELGKVMSGGFTPRWSVYRGDPRLLMKIADFRDTGWRSQISIPRPDGAAARLPRVVPGVVLSGNKVIADENTAGTLCSVWRRAAAIEMEAAGVAAAIYENPNGPAFLMLKAICDQADGKKDDTWQPYAADVAGAFCVAFVQAALTADDMKPSSPEEERGLVVGAVDVRALRLALSSAFDLRELRVAASDLGVDWDDIAGTTKSEKIVELISYLRRRKRVSELVNLVRRERPGLLDSYGS